MRRESIVPTAAFALVGVAIACGQSAEDRARSAAARASAEASVRESATVQRLTTPQDSGRILYDAPTDLSDTSTRAVSRPRASP
jgi:hypothetical protein